MELDHFIRCAISLTKRPRTGLIEVAAAKRSLDGRNDKMEVLYSYLSGQEFRHRVEGIVEAFRHAPGRTGNREASDSTNVGQA